MLRHRGYDRLIVDLDSFASRMISRSFERRSKTALYTFVKRKRSRPNRVYWRAC